jgi:hypothetical protein
LKEKSTIKDKISVSKSRMKDVSPPEKKSHLVEEAEVVNNIDDVRGVFEKKFSLKIANFTATDGTLVHKAYPSNYHSPNANFNNYHTV